MMLIEALLDEIRRLRARAKMGSSIDEIESKIARLRLEPGDVLIVKTSWKLQGDQMKALRDRAKQFVPNNEVLLITENLDVNVRRRGRDDDESLEWQ